MSRLHRNTGAPGIQGNPGAPGLFSVRAPFTTDGGGGAVVASLIGLDADVWTYESGTQGILLKPLGVDYTFVSGTGTFSGLDATKTYLAYGY